MARPIPRDAPVTNATRPSRVPWPLPFPFVLFMAGSSWLVGRAFKDGRHALASADAKRNQSVTSAGAVQFVKGFYGEEAAGGANGVSEGNGPAVGIGPVERET